MSEQVGTDIDFRREGWLSLLIGELSRGSAEIRFANGPPLAIDIFVTDLEEYEPRRDVESMHYWPLREDEVVFEQAA